jgi:hypothetical protein
MATKKHTPREQLCLAPTSKHCTRCRETKPRDEFYSHGRYCKACSRAYYWANRDAALAQAKKLYRANREARLECQREYRLKNRERFAQKDRAYYLRNQERIEDYRRFRKYGVTREQYDAMRAAQGGGCAICGSPAPGRGKTKLHVDHDHATGQVRGLLCGDCNTAIGSFRESVARLLSAAEYLRKHKGEACA